MSIKVDAQPAGSSLRPDLQISDSLFFSLLSAFCHAFAGVENPVCYHV